MSGASGGRRVCLLTGAGGQLGTACCEQLRERYDVVAVCGSRLPPPPDQHRRYVDALRPGAPLDEPAVFTVHADLTDAADVDRVVELALARFGRVDLLVNAAAYSVWAPIVGSSALLASMRRQFETNVEAPLRLAAAVGTAFWRDRRADNLAGNRNVVNVSSIAGAREYPGQGQSVYAASKAALNMLTLHMASEFAAFGVRVNATAPNSFPGRVETSAVVDAIVAFDQGDMTGTIETLDQPEAANARTPEPAHP